jgi:hypothetical protein
LSTSTVTQHLKGIHPDRLTQCQQAPEQRDCDQH